MRRSIPFMTANQPLVLASVFAATLSGASLQAAVTYELLAAEGQLAAGGAPPETLRFEDLTAAATTDSGLVTFSSITVPPGGGFIENSLWSATPAGFNFIARGGFPVPDLIGKRFSIVPVAQAFDETGNVYFTGGVGDAGAEVLCRHNQISGLSNLLLENRTLAPGVSGARFRTFTQLASSPNGTLAIAARLDTNQGGAWVRDTFGSLRLALLEGDVLPGTSLSIDAVFGVFGVSDARVAFIDASLNQVGSETKVRAVVRQASAPGATPSVVLAEGFAAPGFSGFSIEDIEKAVVRNGIAFIPTELSDGDGNTRWIVYRGTLASNLTVFADLDAISPTPLGHAIDSLDGIDVSSTGRLVTSFNFKPITGSGFIDIIAAQDTSGRLIPIQRRGGIISAGNFTGMSRFSIAIPGNFDRRRGARRLPR